MSARWWLALLVACGGSKPAPPPTPGPESAHADHAHHDAMVHRFEHADEWAKQFDDPARDAWQKPDEVVAALALSPSLTVADIGAGTGYFESRLAHAASRVLAVDIEPDMVRYLRERAAREGTPNVEAVLGTPEDPSLPAGGVDRILIVDTWHHIPSRVEYSKKLAVALKPGGFVLVVDFTQETDKGPPKHHRIPPDEVMAELEQAGLHAEVIAETLPDQFIVRASR